MLPIGKLREGTSWMLQSAAESSSWTSTREFRSDSDGAACSNPSCRPSFLDSISTVVQKISLPRSSSSAHSSDCELTTPAAAVLHFATMDEAVCTLGAVLLQPGLSDFSNTLPAKSKALLRLSIPGFGPLFRQAHVDDQQDVASTLSRLVLDSIAQGAITLDPSSSVLSLRNFSSSSLMQIKQ